MKAFLNLLRLPAVVLFLPFAPASGQTDPQPITLTPDPSVQGGVKFSTLGTAGRLFFAQFSCDLKNWTYLDTCKLGAGTPVEYGFAVTGGGGRAFFRIKYTTATNYTTASGDIDGDGISNSDETKYWGTDPLVHNDPDNDGYNTVEETQMGSDPNSASSVPFDPQALPKADFYVDRASYAASTRSALAGQADGSLDLPFETISAAISAAPAGAAIEVAPGTYPEKLTIGGKNLRIFSRPGQREATIISASGEPYGVSFTAGAAESTVLCGFTVRSAGGPGIKVEGASPRILNCILDANAQGITSKNSSPVIINTTVRGSTSQVYGNGINQAGTGNLKAIHCTVYNNARSVGSGQVSTSGGACGLSLFNTVVWSDTLVDDGVEITSVPGSPPVYAVGCSIKQPSGVWPGTGNVNAAPVFDSALDADTATRAASRMAKTSGLVDAAQTWAAKGFWYLTRVDADGELRGRSYTSPIALTAEKGEADIGADEYVSRLKFPTTARKNQGTTQFSEVDEASDVAYLGNVSGTNAARIAVINDEVIEKDGNEANNQNALTTYDIDAVTGELTGTNGNRKATDLRWGSAKADNETRDCEALTWDPVNRNLYVVTSQTKRNVFRNTETSTAELEPLTNPPVNDFDNRRDRIIRVAVSASLVPDTSAASRWQTTGVTSDGWRGQSAATAATAVPPSAFEPDLGLAKVLIDRLSSNAELQDVDKNAGVLVAWNTTPKFGTPVNGQTYAAGTALPYIGQGGTVTTAGTSLGEQTYTQSGTAGLIHSGRTANTTYYYKAWGYDTSHNYTPVPETAAVKTDGVPSLRINEFLANYPVTGGGKAPGWVELFNASGEAMQLDNYALNNSLLKTNGYTFPVGTTIPARGFLQYSTSSGNWSIDPSASTTSNMLALFRPNESIPFEKYGWNREQKSGNGEGRAWDGGPRGLKDVSTGLSEGAMYKPGSNYQPTTPGASNDHPNTKYLQASVSTAQDKVYLHWKKPGFIPSVKSYSPKQHDFHSINVEGLAYKSATEAWIGLRSPLSHRTTGNALALKVTNWTGLVGGNGGWFPGDQTTVDPSVGSVTELNLNGQGIRSMQWIPNLPGGEAYLIIGGPANGGPLRGETGREKFSLYKWSGVAGVAPVRLIENLRRYTVRPEGVNLITVGTELRVIFVEDRYKSTGYDARNGIHWPSSILGL